MWSSGWGKKGRPRRSAGQVNTRLVGGRFDSAALKHDAHAEPAKRVQPVVTVLNGLRGQVRERAQRVLEVLLSGVLAANKAVCVQVREIRVVHGSGPPFSEGAARKPRASYGTRV